MLRQRPSHKHSHNHITWPQQDASTSQLCLPNVTPACGATSDWAAATRFIVIHRGPALLLHFKDIFNFFGLQQNWAILTRTIAVGLRHNQNQVTVRDLLHHKHPATQTPELLHCWTAKQHSDALHQSAAKRSMSETDVLLTASALDQAVGFSDRRFVHEAWIRCVTG